MTINSVKISDSARRFFLEMEAAPPEKNMMVGATFNPDGSLSLVDRTLLRFGYLWMQANNITWRALGHPDVVNLASEYGGRDFLKEDYEADLLFLCNVPDNDLMADCSNLEVLSWLAESFQRSALHTLENWRKRVHDTGAKIIFISGIDSFEPRALAGNAYICFPTGHEGFTALVSRTYLHALYMTQHRTPLLEGFGGETLEETLEKLYLPAA